MPRRRRNGAADEDLNAPSAMEVALHFLGTRPRSRHEIEQRLRRSSVANAEVDATLERLSELGYVDDAAFARWWAEQRDRHAPRGRRMLEAELRQRGIARDVIEEFREEHAAPERAPEDQALPGSEEDRARDALERHLHGRPMPDDFKARQRLGMFLVRRGFEAETVRSVVRARQTEQDDTV